MSETECEFEHRRLGDIGLVRLGKTPRKEDYRSEGEFKILKFRDVLEPSSIDWNKADKGFVSDAESSLRGLREVRPGDVLVTASAHMSEHIGKKAALVTSVPSRFKEVYVCGEILQIRPNPEVDPRWILNYFRSRNGYKELQKQVHGVHLIASRAREIRIPVPARHKQVELLAEIDKQFSRLDEAVANLQRVKAKLKRYKASVLNEFFDSKSSGWRKCQLKAVCQVISGFAFKSTDFSPEGVPVVKIANIGYGEFHWKDQEYLPSSFLESQRAFAIQPCDLLMALTRPITNGTLKVCLYPHDGPVALLNQRVAVLRVGADLEREFLLLMMQSAAFKNQLQNALSETLQPNLSPVDLKNFEISIPSGPEQSRIVAEVDRHLSIIREVEAEVDANLQRAQALQQATLRSAFNRVEVA